MHNQLPVLLSLFERLGPGVRKSFTLRRNPAHLLNLPRAEDALKGLLLEDGEGPKAVG